MSIVDYILLTIVGIPTVLALWMGLVRIAVLLVGLVAAFFAASRLSELAGSMLGQWIPNQTAADTAGFALVFVATMVVAGLVGSLINKLFDLANISWLDRVLGMLLGTASGLLVVAVASLIYTSYTSPDKPWIKNSTLAPYAIRLGDLLGKAIPEGYPFSRQDEDARLPSPQQMFGGDTDNIPAEDKKALQSLIEQQMK